MLVCFKTLLTLWWHQPHSLALLSSTPPKAPKITRCIYRAGWRCPRGLNHRGTMLPTVLVQPLLLPCQIWGGRGSKALWLVYLGMWMMWLRAPQIGKNAREMQSVKSRSGPFTSGNSWEGFRSGWAASRMRTARQGTAWAVPGRRWDAVNVTERWTL